MKQRDAIVMSDAEIDTFLTGQRSSTVATLGPQGQVHLVGMWFAWFDGHVWFETKPKSQKVRNLRRDDRLTFLVEAGHTYDQLRGVSMEGRGVVVEDDAELLERVCLDGLRAVQRAVHPELKPFLDLMMHNRWWIRLDVERTRRWDTASSVCPPWIWGYDGRVGTRDVTSSGQRRRPVLGDRLSALYAIRDLNPQPAD